MGSECAVSIETGDVVSAPVAARCSSNRESMPENTSWEAYKNFTLSRRRPWGGPGAHMVLRSSARAHWAPKQADPVLVGTAWVVAQRK